jgi:hypothetical protein
LTLHGKILREGVGAPHKFHPSLSHVP